jgi:copper oxidase (laccase) domain-containing protein
VIENLIDGFECMGEDIVAHLGPAISKYAFEIGEEVKDIYLKKNASFERSFSYHKNKLFLDLYDAARVVLESYQISSISGGDRCTYKEIDYFFSYRRDGKNSGRMAHLIWMI